MDALLVYALLLIFFLGLLPAIWLVLKERGSEAIEKAGDLGQKQEGERKITVEKAASYGLLGLILAFLLLVTVLARQGKSERSSTTG